MTIDQILNDKGREIISIKADSSLSDGANARIAQQVVQKLIDIFQEENLSGDRRETKQSLAFLDQQIAGRAKQLEAADQRRIEFAQRYAGLLPGAGSISQRMDAARMEINTIDSQLVQAQSALSAMNGQLAGTPQTLPGVGASGGPSALAQAQANLASMKARGWTNSHPDVIAAFRSLVNNEDTISDEAITQHFGAHEDYADYLQTNIQEGAYIPFTDDLFTR